MNERHRGILEMVAAMGISGTIGWVVLHSNLPVISLVFWRCIFGAIALFIVCAALGVFRGNLTRRVITFAALGGVAIVANWLLLFAAFPLASISIATAVYSTQPFILVGLGAAFLGEKINATKLLWLGLCFCGALLIVQARPSADDVGAGYPIGIAMAFGAAFCYALASIFAKKLQGTPPHLIALIQVCVGVFMLAPFVRVSAVPANVNAWGSLMALGVIYTGLVFTLQYGAMQRLPILLTGSLYFVYPTVSIVVDVLAFDHKLRPIEVIGIAAILVGAAGVNLSWRVWRSGAQKEAARG